MSLTRTDSASRSTGGIRRFGFAEHFCIRGRTFDRAEPTWQSVRSSKRKIQLNSPWRSGLLGGLGALRLFLFASVFAPSRLRGYPHRGSSQPTGRRRSALAVFDQSTDRTSRRTATMGRMPMPLHTDRQRSSYSLTATAIRGSFACDALACAETFFPHSCTSRAIRPVHPV
jgi:hypothetical protein